MISIAFALNPNCMLAQGGPITPRPREQEQSIKAKARDLRREQRLGPRKPFADYLAQTEATPSSTGQKAALWGVERAGSYCSCLRHC